MTSARTSVATGTGVASGGRNVGSTVSLVCNTALRFRKHAIGRVHDRARCPRIDLLEIQGRGTPSNSRVPAQA